MRLTRNIAIIIEIDLIKGIEAIRQIIPSTFLGAVIISLKKQALEEANTPRNG